MHTVTFYSYKGGTGRTLLMANLALAAARLGKSVVAMDLDLEAPGLGYKLLPGQHADHPGVVDWLSEKRHGDDPDVAGFLAECEVTAPYREGGRLFVMPAGQAPSPDYFRRLRSLRLDDWVEMGDGADMLLELQGSIQEALQPDLLLIDSRTGITATNAVTTRVLADAVVVLVLNSAEQLDGTRSVLRTLQPLTSLRTHEAIAVKVVLSRFASGPGPDDPTFRTTEEQRALDSVRSFLTEPAWPLANTLELRPQDVLLVRADSRLARREFLPLAQAKRYVGSVHDQYLSILNSVVPGLVGRADLADVLAGDRTGDTHEFFGYEWVGQTRPPGEEDLVAKADRLRLRAGTDSDAAAELARVQLDLSNAHRHLGDRFGAIVTGREAVNLYRDLAEANPAAYTPNLATSVNNYAIRLGEAGRRDEALTYAKEAVDLYRDLAGANPAAYGRYLEIAERVLAWVSSLS